MDPAEEVARPGMTEWLSKFLRSDNTGGVFYGWRLVLIGILVILVGREIGEAIGRTAYAARLHDHVGIEPPWNVAAIAGGACVGSAATIGSVYAWQVASQGGATFEDIDKLGSFETLTSMAGILIGGVLSYRFPVRFVLASAAIVQTVGVALLLAGYGPVLLESGVLLGVASGIGPALEIAAVGIYFGRRSFGMIVVTSLFVGSIVPGVVLPGAGYLRDLTGAYIPVAVGAAVISLIGAALYLALGQPRLSPSQQAEDPAIS